MALEAFKDIAKKITHSTTIDRALVEEVSKDIQRALLRADVNVKMVKEISDAIKKRALSEDVLPTFNAREHVVKIVYEELMRGIGEGLEVPLKKSNIMLVGLQGSGKTTTTAKMAKYFKDKGMKAGVLTADTWRPAAYDQLKQMADKYNIPFYGEKGNENAVEIVKNGFKELKDFEMTIVDTAGRHALEDDLIKEMVEISRIMNPDYKLLVVDAAMGQLASKQARTFHDAIGIDGVVITKFDGTAKGGGALSAAKEIGIPIAFIGTGEKVEEFEKFDPEGFVSRLLGMGDIKALMEKAEMVATEEDLDPEAFMKGKFTLKDVYKQMEAMKKMGPLSKVMDMLPFGAGMQMDEDTMEVTQDKMRRFRVIMDSMTDDEMTNPKIVDSSRVKRIAIGSGTSQQEVRELLKYYKTMKNMMKKMKKGKLGKMPFKGMDKFGF